MKIGGIGSGDDNPFLKKRLDEDSERFHGIEPKENQSAGGVDKTDKTDKTKETEGGNKAGNEEGAASQYDNPNAKLDKSQFTNEDDIQEIDMQEFDDDFKY